MAGYKDFSDGNVLTGDELDGYLQRQTVMRFPTAVALTSSLGIASGVRAEGMLAWADDTRILYCFNEVVDAWVPWESHHTQYLPQLTMGAGNVTNGNAQQFGEWRYSGGMVKFIWRYIVGATTNMGAGNLGFPLPVAAHSSLADGFPLGHWVFKDASGPGPYYQRTLCTLGSASTAAPLDDAGVRQSATVPATFGIGDVLSANLHYRPADSVWLT